MKTPYLQCSSYTHFLPWTKTKCHGESIILVSQIESSNPLHLLWNHLLVNNLNSSLPLFAYETPHGSCALTKRKFLIRCNEIWSKLGYPHTTGHSFWIGGTTELLLSGVPPDIVKMMGCWSSDSFLRYWHSLDDLAPLYAKNVHRSGRFENPRPRRHKPSLPVQHWFSAIRVSQWHCVGWTVSGGSSDCISLDPSPWRIAYVTYLLQLFCCMTHWTRC